MNTQNRIITYALLTLAVAGFFATLTSSAASEETGTIYSTMDTNAKELKGVPAMISVLQNGNLIDQVEITLPGAKNFTQPAGLYDVRVEAEGALTEVKRGVHVFTGHQLTLAFVLKAGKGLHTVEYAMGGLAREEVAARLNKLDTEVADLQAQMQKLSPTQH